MARAARNIFLIIHEVRIFLEFQHCADKSLMSRLAAVKHSAPKETFSSASAKAALPRAVDSLLSIEYTSTLRLVSIADNKANMILSANSIVLSILFAVLSRLPAGQPLHLLVPLSILSLVCLVTSIYAILAARPKVIHVSETQRSISKSPRLLTRVLFTEMQFAQFEKEMTHLISDDEQIYSNLLEGIYANGQVLQQKFKYLAKSYSFFLWGLSLSVITYLFFSFIHLAG